MRMSEVCNANMTSLPIDIVHSLIKSQTSFQAGELKHFLPQWEAITNDPTILQIVSGVKLEFNNSVAPVQHSGRPSVFNSHQHSIVNAEIAKLLAKGVIVPAAQETEEFISTIFLRPKKDGTHRTILNLKACNEFIAYHHFKMDTLEAAVNMMRPGCFMASVDLKDAYYTVPIHPSHQKYLKFCFDSAFYKYTCLPNGLASAPRIFTKLLKPVYATLRSMGHLNSGYIDDSYLQGDNSKECHRNVIDTIMLFTKLGFHIHPEKSVFIPSQKLTFLGFVLDSIAMTVTPTGEKVQRILFVCTTLLQTQMPTIRQVAEVIGTLVSNFPGAQYGPLHYRHLERDKYLALLANKGDYGGIMQLSPPALTELKWWRDNAATLKRDIQHDHPSSSIQSDASTLGWGAVFGTRKTGGRWTPSEAEYHINILELLAAFFALKCFCSHMSNCHIQIQIDNTTAVAYINNMGGSKSKELNQLAVQIWEWCIIRNIWLSAVHIPGRLNTGADEKSRVFSDNHEWMLNKHSFDKILLRHPGLDFDLFASRLNYQISRYCSWQADPNSTHVDAFTMNWNGLKFYAFPPFSLLPRCLQKISQDRAQGILIAPLWPTQTWFPVLLRHLCDQPWILLPRPNLLQHPSRSSPHPLHKNLHLMVCPVSGDPSAITTFQRRLPTFSWHPGGKALKNSMPHTLKNGWHFVVNGKLIVIHHH